MRIISGIAGGRTLIAPKGLDTRPTQDYVRESLFNIIKKDVSDASVLDLFAGSGALGLESLSRGASEAVFVDKARQAVDCIKRNVKALGFHEQCMIRQGDWRSVLLRLSRQAFNVVFLDPPYHLTRYPEITDTLHEKKLLAQNALIVIEHRKNVAITLSPQFSQEDVRAYGDTVIHFYRYKLGGNNDGK